MLLVLVVRVDHRLLIPIWIVLISVTTWLVLVLEESSDIWIWGVFRKVASFGVTAVTTRILIYIVICVLIIILESLEISFSSSYSSSIVSTSI